MATYIKISEYRRDEPLDLLSAIKQAIAKAGGES